MTQIRIMTQNVQKRKRNYVIMALQFVPYVDVCCDGYVFVKRSAYTAACVVCSPGS